MGAGGAKSLDWKSFLDVVVDVPQCDGRTYALPTRKESSFAFNDKTVNGHLELGGTLARIYADNHAARVLAQYLEAPFADRIVQRVRTLVSKRNSKTYMS